MSSSSSVPIEGQPTVMQQDYSPHSSKGSVGPVIGVLAVITVLGVIAVVIGRLCAGRRYIGGRYYDFEGWIERKCASCIDGRIENSGVPHSTAASTPVAGGSGPMSVPTETSPESKPAVSENRNPSSSV